MKHSTGSHLVLLDQLFLLVDSLLVHLGIQVNSLDLVGKDALFCCVFDNAAKEELFYDQFLLGQCQEGLRDLPSDQGLNKVN